MTMATPTNLHKPGAHSEPGANAIGAYQLLGHLVAVYAHAAKLCGDPGQKERWESATAGIVDNVGTVYDFWSKIRTEGDYALVPRESEHVQKKIKILSQRLSGIASGIGDWTPSCRLSRVYLRCEARWQGVLDEFKREYEHHTATINQLLSTSRSRVRTLKSIMEDCGMAPIIEANEVAREVDAIEITVDDL
jgi:hypothetical protein